MLLILFALLFKLTIILVCLIVFSVLLNVIYYNVDYCFEFVSDLIVFSDLLVDREFGWFCVMCMFGCFAGC